MGLFRKPESVAPAISAERAALAKAITTHNEMSEAHGAAVKAEQALSEAVWAANAAIDAATTGIEEAQEAEARYLRDEALGHSGAPPTTVRDARDALADAESKLVATKGAHEAVRAEVARLDPSFAKSRIEAAVAAVLRVEGRAEVYAVAAELERVQNDLIRLGQALEFLVQIGAFPVTDTQGARFGKPADDGIFATYKRMSLQHWLWHDIAKLHDGAAPWHAAVAALEADANAPLPGGL